MLFKRKKEGKEKQREEEKLNSKCMSIYFLYKATHINSRASGGDGILAELCQILKDDAVKVLNSICQQIWKTQQWPQDWKRSVFIPVPKKANAKECLVWH